MGFHVPTEWMTVEIHEISRSYDNRGVTDVTAIFPWDGEDVILKQHPSCRDRAIKTHMASFKIGDRIQVKGMMNVSHFIDPQARRAFHPTLIVDQIKDDEDVDERANESSPDSPVPEEDSERRSSSSKRSRTSTSRTNRRRFRKNRILAPHGLDRSNCRREDVHRDCGYAEEHGSNGYHIQDTRQMWTGSPSVVSIEYEEKDQRNPHGNTSDVGTAGSIPPAHDPLVVLDQSDQQANGLNFDDGNGQPGPPFNDGPLVYDDINWDKWYTHPKTTGTHQGLPGQTSSTTTPTFSHLHNRHGHRKEEQLSSTTLATTPRPTPTSPTPEPPPKEAETTSPGPFYNPRPPTRSNNKYSNQNIHGQPARHQQYYQQQYCQRYAAPALQPLPSRRMRVIKSPNNSYALTTRVASSRNELTPNTRYVFVKRQ
ncbi:hypothetical protein BGX30_001036 [Mortierella sp. GBA39]|nr:hypothetical protein BGX30_001036 [Mortierella sp. GBA39]